MNINSLLPYGSHPNLESLVARVESERPEEVADLTGLQERVMGCHGDDEPSADDGAFGEWMEESRKMGRVRGDAQQMEVNHAGGTGVVANRKPPTETVNEGAAQTSSAPQLSPLRRIACVQAAEEIERRGRLAGMHEGGE